jgi:hypothetical protein
VWGAVDPGAKQAVAFGEELLQELHLGLKECHRKYDEGVACRSLVRVRREYLVLREAA